MKKFTDCLLIFSAKFAQNRFLNVIQHAFMMMLPITMVGSFASLFKGISFGGYQTWLQSTPLYDALGAVYQWSVGMIALYIAFLVAYSFTDSYRLKINGISVGLASLMGFLIVTPYNVTDSNLPTQWLGAPGMFVAILIAFMTGGIFMFCEKKNIRITMPDSVPPMVASQFTALFPVIFTAIITVIIRVIFGFLPAGSITQAVYSAIQTPLNMITGSVSGYYLLMVILYMLWFFGIHGGMTVGPIIMMLFMPIGMENLAAFQAGQTLPHAWIGTALTYGNGSLPMLLAMLLFAKSESNKSITKLALIPSFFGVDEPAYFGIPMILNPIFFIPWVILTPAVSVFGTYLLTVMKLIPYANGARGSGFEPFFITNMIKWGWKGVLWGCVLMVICVIIYIPFVKVYDKQKLAEEKVQTEAE